MNMLKSQYRVFGLRLKKTYIIKVKWKRAVKQWFNSNSEPLHKLRKQLNEINHELRQIRRRQKAL